MASWMGAIPPLLAALLAAWCGNLLGGVTAAGSATTLAVLLLLQTASPGPWHDPLRLRGAARAAPAALWLIVAASAWASPVPRAALQAVVLLPAYLLLPGAVARCWAAPAARRLGARAAAAAVLALGAWALLAAARGAPDAAPALPAAAEGASVGATLAPLGHHTLLGTWMAILLPLALLPLRERTAWRWLGVAAGLVGLGAVLAARSLGAGVALGAEALLAAAWFLRSSWPRPGRGGWRRLAVGALALVVVALAVAQVGRVRRIGAQRDRSVAARAVYLRAGWEGWRERPWLGWGPGSVAWTAAWFLVPRPGLNPWGEAVGELHSLPIELAYETGALGLAAAVAVFGLFLRRRWRERGAVADPALLAVGCLGLAGGAVAWLGTAAVAVQALPFAMTLAAGAALAARGKPEEAAGAPPSPQAVAGALGVGSPPAPPAAFGPGGPGGPGRAGRPGGERCEPAGGTRGGLSLAACVYGLVAAAALLAPEVARWHYDRAVAAGEAGRRRAAVAELAAAMHLDPGFPLYGMRLALLEADRQEDRVAAAALAATAARQARGAGLPWLVAGILGRAAGEVWAAAALEQGCALDPLSPYAPFYLAMSRPDSPLAPRLAARALLAEPRLAAATVWEGREELFRRTLEEVRRWPGVDPGWKLGLLAAAPRPEERRGARRSLALAIDAAGFTQSTSLHLFRRVPWPALWPLIPVREALLPALGLPPATAMAGPDGTQFVLNACIPH